MTTVYRDKHGKIVRTDPGTRPAGARQPARKTPPPAPAPSPAGKPPSKQEKKA
jgi:hypothetical protein